MARKQKKNTKEYIIQKQIESNKNSVTELIKSLTFKNLSAKEQKLNPKDVVANKKITFDNAKHLLSKIYSQTIKDNDETNTKWFKTAISDLINAAYSAIEVLFDISNEKMDFNKSSMKDQKDFSASKKEASDQVTSFYNSIEELEDMFESIEANEGSLKFSDEKDFQKGWAEKYHELLDKVSNHKAGYNEDLDSVFICPKGTMGKTIVVDGLRITLPKKPAERKIKKRHQKSENQFWEREKLPSGLTRDNAESFEAYIEKNHRFLREGYWFYNNGEPEYLTGAHWLLLQWLKTEADHLYFDFRIAHRDLFYFWEAVWHDERSLGSIMGKSRRSGITHCALAFELTKSLIDERNRFGQTSMTDTYAEINFDRLTMMFSGLPFFIQPVSNLTGKRILYSPPRKKTSVNNRDVEDLTEGFLANRLDYMPTKEDSYDSTAQKLYFADELSKWRKGENITKHYDTVKSVLTKGAVVHGKMLIVSTVRYYTGSTNADEKQNGDRYAELYNDSRLDTRVNKLGRTGSGLYKIFIAAGNNFEGCIDRYGYPVRELQEGETRLDINGNKIKRGADEIIREEYREKLKGDIARYNQACREYPQQEEDMFKTEEDDGVLDTVLIDEQIDHNNFIVPDLEKKGQVSTFDLEWKDGKPFTKVVKHPKANGNFIEYHKFPESRANKVRERSGRYFPGNEDDGAFGIDVYKFSATGDNRGSKQAIHLFSSKQSSIFPKNALILRYLARRQTVEAALSDAIKAMWYYGMPALIENNIPNLLERMRDNNMRKFAIDRVDKKKRDLNTSELELGGQPTTGVKIKEDMLNTLKSYVFDYLGTGENRVLDNTTLFDWRKLDGVKWTKNDASISSSLSLLAVKKIDEKYEDKDEKQEEKPRPLINFYTNKNGKSTRIWKT